jgi:SAM-dependent methyltransferase
MAIATAPDLTAITTRQQRVWSAGDFSRIGALNLLHAEHLCESLDLLPGERVLDVAAGHGNTSLSAARRFCEVTATDFVPELLEIAERRAALEHLPLTVRVADAQDLPFPDESFDVVISTFGAMFAPDQERTARELLRVCRAGGRIGMNNWHPESFIGDVFRTIASHVAPPPGLRSPLEWGDEQRVRELLGGGVRSLRLSRVSGSGASSPPSTCSATSSAGTDRPTSPSPRSKRTRRTRSPAICSASSPATTAPATPRWSPRLHTSKSPPSRSDQPRKEHEMHRHETEQKSFEQPDEVREFPNGRAEILQIGGGVVGRFVFEPGWRWSNDVKPIAGTPSCEAPHFQYHVSGKVAIRMDDGTEFIAGPGDITSLPTGHDAWVVGDEQVVIVDWFGASNYAKDN